MVKDIREKLQALFFSYAKNLPNKISSIENEWEALRNNWDQNKFKDFHRNVHSLCGSAGTYGYAAISKSARELEVYLKSLLDNRMLSSVEEERVTQLLVQLKATFQRAVPEQGAMINLSNTIEDIDKCIYILDPDDKFIKQLENHFQETDFEIYQLKNLEELQQKKPVVVIIDIDGVDDTNIKIFHELQQKNNLNIPLFCTSIHDDMLTRLKAIRMGNSAFFPKPIEPYYLSKAIDQVSGLAPNEPYRILIIEDSPSLAEYYSLILSETGMITYSITNPLLFMDSIEKFQPDLILMDIYMPECTGLELALILRQDLRYTRIPIIFLSTEDDRFKQLSALTLGGDDFLTKPVVPQQLIEAVRSRAKRSGILSSFMMKDSLTTLLNHTNILQRLQVEIARAQRSSETLSFVMIDIDHFKMVNDTYGHLVGDKVIKKISYLLQTVLRKSDIPGRYGGEEFAVILPNTDEANAVIVCEKLRESLSQYIFTSDDKKFNVTVSIGISSFPSILDIHALVAAADRALYTAKHNGRNRVVIFHPN